MTRKVKWKIITLPLILAMTILLCLTFLPHSKTSAEMLLGDNQTLSVSDTYYSMSIQGYNRNNAVLEAKISEEVEVIDQKIAYVCYDWSSVSHLKISMQRSSNTDPNFNFLGYELRLSYMQTENLSQNIHDFNGKKFSDLVIYSSSTSSSMPSFTYYINEIEGVKESEQTKIGYGFGLYKFEFVYKYLDTGDTSQEKATEKSIGSIYVAILPDDIDTTSGSFGITYTVSSSSTFLNAFTFKIDNDTYKYVNPCYIVWFVDGVDKGNMHYVLTESDREGQFFSYSALWDSYENRNGNTFYFDSNGIEADFTVTCSIYDSEGNLKAYNSVDITTIKVNPVSYLWLIIVGIILTIVIISSIILIFVLKKKEKMY